MAVVEIIKYSDISVAVTLKRDGSIIDLINHSVAIQDTNIVGLNASITDAANGQITVTLDDIESQALKSGLQYYFRLVIEDSFGIKTSTERILCQAK